jgi:signal transduction histidine kinase
MYNVQSEECMTIQKQNQKSLQEMVAALAELAQITQRASSAALSPESEDSSQVLAEHLLSCLVSFCHARQGALLFSTLTSQSKPQETVDIADIPLKKDSFPLVAHSQMSDLKVSALLADFPKGESDTLFLAHHPDTLVWRRSFPIDPVFASIQPMMTQAFFLLDCSDLEQGTTTRESRIERLTFLKDAVDAALMNILHILYRHQQMNHDLLSAEVLATVGHELRGPLTSIRGYATTLLRHEQRLSHEERHDFLTAINDESQRLERSIDQLLELSLLEKHKLTLAPVPVHPAYLLQEAITVARERSGRAILLQEGASWFHYEATEHDEGGSTKHNEENQEKAMLISGDHRLLRVLLDHLLENAVHYSPSHTPVEVGLCLRSHEEILADHVRRRDNKGADLIVPPNRFWVEIWVRDYGIGIAPEHLSLIFDRFYRVDMSLTREVNGLGLGLTICQYIVRLHQGLIWGESTAGIGSTFHVLLPSSVTEIV